MKAINGITLENVKEVYSGAEGDLWELVMGEQIHIGGFVSSMALANKANIKEGMNGVDFCCCNGAGMRFLIHFIKVAGMIGVDATEKVINRGKERCKKEGVEKNVQFILNDVCSSGLPDAKTDFVWGEDAWCYVENKKKMISEASRIIKKNGIIAFTDWVEGDGLSDEESERFLKFMKFPNILNINDYTALLEENGCDVIIAEDTKQFAPYVDLYLNMLTNQLTYDALRIIGFDMQLMQILGGEMVFMQKLAHSGKIAQGRFIAKKK